MDQSIGSLRAAVESAAEQERDRDRRRDVRAEGVRALTPREFAVALDELRVRTAHRMRLTPEVRGGAFPVLTDTELALLDQQLVRYAAVQRLSIGSDPQQRTLLHALRANQVTGRAVLTPEAFRGYARTLCAMVLQELTCRCLTPGYLPVRIAPATTDALRFVVPWRAGLLFAEVCHDAGHVDFRHVGISRNEHTLEPLISFDSGMHSGDQRRVHVIADPMLATGGTTAAIIDQLVMDGVIESRILVQAIVAAPEGIDFLLHTYPRIRICTAAVDERLDQRGYIAGPGLGDFGDLAFADVDTAYARHHWVERGILTPVMAERIVARTRAIAAQNREYVSR